MATLPIYERAYRAPSQRLPENMAPRKSHPCLLEGFHVVDWLAWRASPKNEGNSGALEK